MEELLKLLKDVPPITNTKLDDQIKYMEGVNKLFTNPMSISIINSLKELKGIKSKTLNV